MMETAFLLISIIAFTTKGETIYCDAKGSVCTCDSFITGETCYLDCAREDACQDACVIDCTGEDGCGGNAKIMGSEATELTIICGDEASCKGNTEIYCGIGHCHILCTQYDSCEDTSIYTNTASSFECLPLSHCQEADIISALSKTIISSSPSAESHDSNVNVSAEHINDNPSVDNPDIDIDTQHTNGNPSVDNTDTDITEDQEDIEDIDVASFDATPETQGYGVKTNEHKQNESDTLMVSGLVVAIIAFVVIGVAAIVACCYWKKLRYRKVIKDAMMEYGSLSSV
eukprot:11185_1